MDGTPKVSRWLGWFFVVLVASVIALLAFRMQREEKVVLWADQHWTDLEERGVLKVEEKLKGIVIPEINFKDRNFYEAVEELDTLFYEYDLDGDGIDLKIHESVPEELNSITLRLTNVPAGEGLRCVSSLASLKYRVDENGSVAIVPLSHEDDAIVEGWFDASFMGLSIDPDATERIDVTRELAERGIRFENGAEAFYDPSKKLLWAKNRTDQMELIDLMFSPSCHFPQPTWKDKAYDFWMRLTGGYPPTPVTPVSPVIPSVSPSSPDPFGGDELDLFGR